MQPVKNILFDLGGVLLDIDYNKTSEAFKRLGIQHFETLFSQYNANELFEKLETGHISEDAFYQSMQQYFDKPVERKDITTAWDAMLLSFRKKSITFLSSIKEKYNLFLLSNTNIIHHRAFQKIYAGEIGKPLLDDHFIKSYYSHQIGLRKPYAATYEFVLQDAGILASETLFIDDSINNIEGAKGLGFILHHLQPTETIENLGL